MNYKKLLIFGDSNSFGVGLSDVDEQNTSYSKKAWGSILQQKLGIKEFDNFSIPGASNEHIALSIRDTLSKLSKEECSNLLVGIMWSQKSRILYPRYRDGKILKWTSIRPNGITQLTAFEYSKSWVRNYILNCPDDYYYYYFEYVQIYYIQLLLEKMNISYFMLFAFEDSNLIKVLNNASIIDTKNAYFHKLVTLSHLINWDSFILKHSFSGFCYKFGHKKPSPEKHFDAKAHFDFVNRFLYSEVNNIIN